MEATWREERPDAITAASQIDERPSRSMVTIFSALSSSSEVRMRFNNSLCLAAGAACAAAGLFAAGLVAGFLALAGLAGLAGFLAGTFLLALAGAFLALAGAFLALAAAD